jgi:hypothetical protein
LPRRTTSELPPWGRLNKEDLDTIKENKYPFLTRRIINKLQTMFPINTQTIKTNLLEIQKYNQLINVQPYDKDTRAHYDFFKQEDQTIKTIYDTITTLNTQHSLNIDYETVIKEVLSYSPVILHVKQELNQLRPKQASIILGIPIKVLESKSADTPSLPSGHSIQGMLAAAIIYRDNKPFFDAHTEILGWLVKRCLDIGIRRIIAGLHFPIDHEAAKVFVKEVVQDWNIKPYLYYL